MDFEPLGEARLVADQQPQFRFEGVRQRLGEGGQQHPGVRVGASQIDRPVQRDDGLPVPAEPTPEPGRVVSFDRLALGRVEEDRPLVPGIVQRALQLLDVATTRKRR